MLRRCREVMAYVRREQEEGGEWKEGSHRRRCARTYFCLELQKRNNDRSIWRSMLVVAGGARPAHLQAFHRWPSFCSAACHVTFFLINSLLLSVSVSVSVSALFV
ncbi:hypothetical protein BO82DRAFT_159344 [Aspergillus uvarum CBS 121591]|uniref:Transmembrane protein n=1 Tax=Aspergillus uvarum CBS 121591 TaxID=1448315 RepID=A0A319BZP8_9EURO|nr:hypothetical protein BO82DRAFT_159344 [Aspergillus uvarum CBS 121591]PYH78255.1 hypothetical protein BO82DRAFT_159344 [Aspergillus uvarum CBS 121591]